MKIFLILTVFWAVGDSFRLEKDAEWAAFKEEYGKSYESEADELRRKTVYFENKKFVQEHNARYERGETSFSVKLNRLADLTQDEIAQRYKGFKDDQCHGDRDEVLFDDVGDLSEKVDWRESGAVTPVKDQGSSCGSCWAFSTTGSLEGQHKIKKGNLVSLSEQNLMDCSATYGNHGCSGGYMDSAFKYVVDNHGIDTEASYPYEEKNDKCRYNKTNIGATISSWTDVKANDESSLKQAVAKIGPVSVGIDTPKSFQLYNSGVYDEPLCSNSSLDHAVLVVGYGTENGLDYWLVKNSWGTNWGDDGYIKMSRNKNNQCGIATCASYPVI